MYNVHCTCMLCCWQVGRQVWFIFCLHPDEQRGEGILTGPAPPPSLTRIPLQQTLLTVAVISYSARQASNFLPTLTGCSVGWRNIGDEMFTIGVLENIISNCKFIYKMIKRFSITSSTSIELFLTILQLPAKLEINSFSTNF